MTTTVKLWALKVCPRVGGIFCCFNEVVEKLLSGYEVFYDEDADKIEDTDEDEDEDVVLVVMEFMTCLNVLHDFCQDQKNVKMLWTENIWKHAKLSFYEA